MAGTFYPIVSGDDGTIQGGSFYSGAGSGLTVGNASGLSLHSFIRFVNVTIPQGATITEAKLVLSARASQSAAVCNARISANDVDDAVAPISTTEFNALVLTTATVDWDALVAWTEDSDYDSPEIKTVIQEITDRVGWVDGNALTILVKNNVSTLNAYRSAHAIDDDAGVNVAELYVIWAESINSDVTLPMITAEGFTGIYSAPSLPMAIAEGFTGIYSAPSVPMIRANGTLSDNMVHIQSDVTIPSMTAAITQAKQIWGAVTNPMMTAEITERETVLGNVTIPMMTAELGSGAHANVSVTVPMMTAAGLFSGRCAVTVPMMTAALTGKVGRVGNISVKLPMMTVSITGKTEHLGNISVTVPMMLALAELITGKVIRGAVTLPMMIADLSSYEDIDVDSDVSIPMMTPYLSGTVARFTSCAVVLRYEEPV